MAIIFEQNYGKAPQNKRITKPCTSSVNMHGIATAPEALRSTFAKSFRDGPENGGKEAADVKKELIDNTDKERGAVRRICADTCSIVLRIHVMR